MQPAGQLVVASDIRNTLFRRALCLLDEVHAGLEDFSFGELQLSSDDSSAISPGKTQHSTAIVPSEAGLIHGAALVPHQGPDPLERVLATFVQGRTTTARRAVGAVAQIHNEIDSILSSFERDFPPAAAGVETRDRVQDVSFDAVTAQPSEEVLRMAAATTAAAARFRVRAAESAKAALQVYDNAAKQAALAAQSTTQALEMQILAEQHSAAGNLPQALDAIRQANRLRDESAEAARVSRKLQQEYMRHRREAQEAHMQADAAMRHAYKLEREALKASTEAAERQHAMWKDRYERLKHQAEGLQAQAAALDAEADAAVARAEEAQSKANEEMAAGNYDLSKTLMQEAVRSQEQAGYARAQAAATREALQRLKPDLQAAWERMEETERDMEDLSQRQTRLQDTTTKQRTDRLQEEADELAALCTAAEAAAAMHEDLVNVYEDRLAQDREQYDRLSTEGRLAEADALAVHINTWEELLHVARKNLDASRREATAMHSRLLELSKADVSKDPAAALEGSEDFQQLRGAKDKEALATQAVAILARGLATTALQDATVEGTGGGSDALLLQTEMHRQRIARLAQQMDTERKRLEDGSAFSAADGQSASAQAEAILDSMAVSHLVGTLETTRLLQLWKQRSDQAAASAEELRKRWSALEQDASAKADEAVRLEEQALALEQAGRTDEAASTMAQAEQLHRTAEQLRLEADKAKAALIARETAADNAQAQTRSLVQGLYDVEHAAERLQSELGLRGCNSGEQPAFGAPPVQAEPSLPRDPAQQRVADFTLSAPTNDEIATVMMASPGMLSRSSSTAAGQAYLVSSMDVAGQRMPSFTGHAASPDDDQGPATTRPTGFAAENLAQGDLRQAEQLTSLPSEPWLLTQASTVHGPDIISNKDDIQLHEARLARFIKELELHVNVNAPSIPTLRWGGQAALASALLTGENDEDAVLAISSNLVALQEQVRDSASALEAQLQQDEQRKFRWHELVTALPLGSEPSMAQVADKASRRCAAVAAASKVAGDALVLQAKCHDALVSGISAYRRALSGQRTVAESAKVAQTEAASLQGQAQHAQTLDMELSHQVQTVREQLDAFESQGSTAQALTARFELQRLQNKHAEAAAHSSQFQAAYKAAQQRAHEAQKQEADASTNIQNLRRAVMTLANAANEAGAGAEHALVGYGHAVSALVLGARVDLTRLGAGGDAMIMSPSAEAEVQTHLHMHADQLSHAQQCLQATRRLQQVADSGHHLASSAASGTSRASNFSPLDVVQSDDSGFLTGFNSYAPGASQRDGPVAQRGLGSGTSLEIQPSVHGDQQGLAGSDRLSAAVLLEEPALAAYNFLGIKPSAHDERAEANGSGRQSATAPVEQPVLRSYTFLGIKPSADEQPKADGSSRQSATAPLEHPVLGSYTFLGIQPSADVQPKADRGSRQSATAPMEHPVLGSYKFLGIRPSADVQPEADGSNRPYGSVAVERPVLGADTSLGGAHGEQLAGSDRPSAGAYAEQAALGDNQCLGMQHSAHGSSGGSLSAPHSGPPVRPYRTSESAASDFSSVEIPKLLVNRPVEGLQRTNMVRRPSGDSLDDGRTDGTRSAVTDFSERSALAAGAEASLKKIAILEATLSLTTPTVLSINMPTDAASIRAGAKDDRRCETLGLAASASAAGRSSSGLATTSSAAAPPSRLLAALGDLKLQGVSLFPVGDSQTMNEPASTSDVTPSVKKESAATQGPVGSLQTTLSGSKSLIAPHAVLDFGQTATTASRVASFGGLQSTPAEGLASETADVRSTRPAIITLSSRSSKAVNYDESNNLSTTGYQGQPSGAAAELTAPRILLAGHTSEQTADMKPLRVGTLLVPASASSSSDITEQTTGQAGGDFGPDIGTTRGRGSGGLDLMHGATEESFARRSGSANTGTEPKDWTPMHHGPRPAAETGPEAPASEAVRAIEADLARLKDQHQQQRSQMRMEADAMDIGRSAIQCELEAQLREAEEQLHAAKAQQEYLDDPSPLQIQVHQDKLQYHEHQVAMLQQALDACGELANSTVLMKRTREEMELVDLETQQCEDALELLAKAADMCSAAAREMQLQSSDPTSAANIQQGLAYVREKAKDFAQQRQHARHEAERLHERRQELTDQLAAQQHAVKLREELVQQARKAAAAASDTIAWDARLTAARTELQRLEAPLREMQGKAQAASEAAQTMTMAAAQHRKQAAELSQQAAQQRQDVRRFAANGQGLEADAAKSMADSLQQQADGLLAQATRMEDDARKLKSEARGLELSAERAHKRMAAQAEVVEQVTKAHQLSATAAQFNRTATMKLHDALQKQTVLAEQQLVLAKVEQDLAVMEAQMTGSGSGSAVRPDELASHMINVVRAKQEASRMRAALQATRQQQDQDRDSANAAVRQAAKVEGERTHLEPKIQELEVKANESLRSASVADSRSAPDNDSQPESIFLAMGSELNFGSTFAARITDPTPESAGITAASSTRVAIPREDVRLQTFDYRANSSMDARANTSPRVGEAPGTSSRIPILVQPARSATEVDGAPEDIRVGVSGGSQSTATGRVQLLLSSHAAAATDAAQERQSLSQQQRHVELLTSRTDNLRPVEEPRPSHVEDSEREQLGKHTRSISSSPSFARMRNDGPLADGDAGLSIKRILIGAPSSGGVVTVAAGAVGGVAATTPPARVILPGGNQTQPATSGVSSPAGSVIGGAIGARFDWSPRGTTSMRLSQPSPRVGFPHDGQEDALSDRSPSRASSPSALSHPRLARMQTSPRVQHEDSGLSFSLMRLASRSPDRPVQQDSGTAGDLLDKVASKSLRPLSHVKITDAIGKPVLQPYQQRESTTSFESGARGSSASGVERRSDGRDVSLDGQSDGNANPTQTTSEEEEQADGAGAEPDSKMYRTMKQRVTDLEARIPVLRRHGDTARTAADILGHKQEQRRADMSGAVEADETLQAAILEHGDAMIRMKEAEASSYYKQADLLEDEAVACREAMQYAVVDWHSRREVKRLDERCVALTERAQRRASEALAFDADVADATECIALALSKAGRGARSFPATLEQQHMARFIDEQRACLTLARQRAAESRFEAAQLADVIRGAVARKLLAEKKALCNKALYQSAVELADSFDHAAKIATQIQQVKHLGMKGATDAIAEHVQRLEAGAGTANGHGAKSSPAASKLRSSKTTATRPNRQNEEMLQIVRRISVEVEDAMQQCLNEIIGDASDVLSAHRRRIEQITALVRLYQVSYDCGDHLTDEVAEPTAGGVPARSQPPSEVARRAAQITAAQEAIRDLDRACELAAELRALALNASAVHVSIFERRTEPNVVRAQLLGQKPAAHDPDREELSARKQRLAILEIEIPLTRDQLSAALQVLEYRQAAAQLVEAPRDLQYAASVASAAITDLEATVALHRENLSLIHRHMNAVLHEARVFTANGNVLQAAAAEEAAQTLAKEALAAESTLGEFITDAQLKRDEQLLAGAAAEELQQVADGSLELVGLLLRIIRLQQEARTVSRRINELDGEQARLELESQTEKLLAEQAFAKADLLQHESLQCRTNLKFSAADAHLSESRQHRASAQEHVNAAEAAQQAASASALQHKGLCQRRKQLLREVHLLHTAASHLQGALSCMRDKHHLLRKLRDVEYHLQHGQQPGDFERTPSPGEIAEVDVLHTQVEASIATVKHHLASKTSYVLAADHLHLAEASQDREASCGSQADSAMQDIMKARLASAATGAGPSVPLLTDGHGSEQAGVLVLPASSELALVRHGQSEEQASDALPFGTDVRAVNWHLQQAELRYRCLRGCLPVLKAIAAAAERASEARCKQVDLSDQAAVLVSDLAAKILEAEACANEAASLEAAVQLNAALLDEDDEENLKAKLMLNALLQKAESYRNEALLLQGRIKELEEQERIAANKAADMEASLSRLQADHRHILAALDLAERISQNREQESVLRAHAQALTAEVDQLEREARGMESKTAQLRQQLTNASHTACSEDVANLMLVMQQIDSKLAVNRQMLQQRKLELESNQADYERLSVDIMHMTQRTEHVLHAGETQEQVQQVATRLGELKADLSSAEAARTQCECMLSELRQQYTQLMSAGAVAVDDSEVETPSSLVKARQTQQVASTQAAITLTEQMLETHIQRVAVLQAAITAWEAAKQRQEALLRHQEQLMQQAAWRSTLEQHRAGLRKAAVAHADRAKQMRARADKCTSGAPMMLTAGPHVAEHTGHSSQGGDVVGAVLSQAATIRAASEVATQHERAECEDALAARAAALAHEIDREIKCMAAASELVQPVYERLYMVANASISVARLQLLCVGVCSEQGVDLTSMHDALSSVRDLAGKIQGLLDAADCYARAGHSMKAAAARGEATALQDALQHELKAVRSCRQRLAGLATKMQDATQELSLADKRMVQVTRSAAVTQSVAEYIHRAYELHYECGERQWSGLQLLRQAADATERAASARREHEASQEAEKQLAQAGKAEGAVAVGRVTAALKRSITDAEAERRLLDAQVVQEANACGSDVAAAGMYMDLAKLTVKLLRHMDELESHQMEHEQLHSSLEATRRSHHAASTVLVHRRGEMTSLTGQIEANRLESQLLRKMGNEAQAVVRQDAANLLTSQLAEIAEDVMKLETRCESMEQRLALLTSFYAKSEARMGLFSHLARLCSASIGHLLDARDARDSRTSHMREAAVAAVELSREEASLSEAEERIRELRESLVQLNVEKQSADKAEGELDTNEDTRKLQRAANLAQAELMLAHRRRAEAEQHVLVSRSHVAQAELAAQSCQLRITKARQRAEDAQKLVEDVRSLLNGSTALTISFDNVEAPKFAASSSGAGVVITDSSSAGDTPAAAGLNASHSHGILAAAQLHSVTLQALSEAASKLIASLDCAAAAEQRRSNMLSATQAAKAAREAAARQEGAAAELRAIVEGIYVAQHVHDLTGKRISHEAGALGSDDGTRRMSHLGAQLSSKKASFTKIPDAASVEQGAVAVAGLELERLQHEAAYLEAKAAQQNRLASCLLQQQGLLRLASESLLGMARFGVAAELKAGPNMTADEATSLLDACKHLAEQHAATLLLVTALDSCKEAEGYLRASVDCVEEAKSLREKAIDDQLAALREGSAVVLEPTSALQSALNSSRTPREPHATERRQSHDFAPLRDQGDDMEVKAAARLAAYNQVLVEEERALREVQELDKKATMLLEESNSHALNFAACWAEVARPVQSEHHRSRAMAGSETGFQGGSTRVPKDPLPEALFLYDLEPIVNEQLHRGRQQSTSAVGGAAGALSLSLLDGIGGNGGRDAQDHTTNSLSQVAPSSAGARVEELHTVARLPGGPSEQQIRNAGSGAADIDVDLVAMAAATVARAKAAAAALAAKATSALNDRRLQLVHQAEKTPGRSSKDGFAQCLLPGAKAPSIHASGTAQPCEFKQAAAGGTVQGKYHDDNEHLAKPTAAAGKPALTVDIGGPAIQQAATILTSEAPAASKEAPALHAASPRHQPSSAVQSDIHTTDKVHPDAPKRTEARLKERLHDTLDALQRRGRGTPLKRPAEGDAGRATMARPVPDPALTAPAEAPTAVLSRIPLPDDLDSKTASMLQSLWSNAALHYQRAQHMHDCSLQQTERQWQRCQAQIQMLRAEDLKARSAGRLSEADAVSAALAKWQQRGGHLEAAMRRHRAEYARHKALAYRATVVVERLQLAAASCSGKSGLLTMTAHDSEALQHLLPKLPTSMLADCSVLQSLERLHGDLIQQVAALHSAVAGLQQRSQRMFSKASRRSNKLQVRLSAIEDSAAHAAAIAKSQLVAEQSAALGERAVELAAQARTMQELAEQLSGEGTHCSQLLERLQFASEQELQAQQALVQAADLLLCEAMQAVLRGDRIPGLGSMTIAGFKPDGSGPRAQSEAPSGDLDSLLQGRHPPGACLSAALKCARRGEDLAQEAARTVQSAKEQLESGMGPFLRRMDEAAAALAAIASAHSAQCDSLRAQVDAAALCVARAHTKAAAQRAEQDTAAAEKYSRAAEGWSKQTEKLRKEAIVASGAAEELANRGQALASLGGRLRPIQEVLDNYLDEQLEAWASAALARIQPRILMGQ